MRNKSYDARGNMVGYRSHSGIGSPRSRSTHPEKLPYRELKQGSVLALSFEDNSFDIVFSHGVLHHVPDIDRAQREVHRVLRPHGELIVMLYAKWSLELSVVDFRPASSWSDRALSFREGPWRKI